MQEICKSLPILTVINGLNKYYGKNYCFPSQEKLLNLLEERLGLEISRRTLNRWLASAEKLNLLSRLKRTRKAPGGRKIFQSTLYKICYKGYKLLGRVGVSVVKAMMWFDKRKPQRSRVTPRAYSGSRWQERGQKFKDFLDKQKDFPIKGEV